MPEQKPDGPQFRSIPAKQYDFSTTGASTQYQIHASPFKPGQTGSKSPHGVQSPFKQIQHGGIIVDHEAIEKGLSGSPMKQYGR